MRSISFAIICLIIGSTLIWFNYCIENQMTQIESEDLFELPQEKYWTVYLIGEVRKYKTSNAFCTSISTADVEFKLNLIVALGYLSLFLSAISTRLYFKKDGKPFLGTYISQLGPYVSSKRL